MNASPSSLAAQVVRRTDDARGVVTLTLNRPEAYNALSDELLDHLAAHVDAVEAERDVRAVVIAGSGRAFCAGHDLRELLAASSPEGHQRLFERASAVMLALRQLPMPVIARVHGVAAAAGCQLVAQCDLAVASSSARFAVSGINLGLFCSTPAVALSRNVRAKEAFEMLVTGEFIDAATAQARGLVNRVVPPEALDAELERLLAAILSKSRAAVALGKALFYRQAELGIEAAYAEASRAMACNLTDPDTLERIRAFIDKRTA